MATNPIRKPPQPPGPLRPGPLPEPKRIVPDKPTRPPRPPRPTRTFPKKPTPPPDSE